MIIKDAMMRAANPLLPGIERTPVVYMGSNVLGIPPAFPEGGPFDAVATSYVQALGAQLNYLPRVVINIEYVPTRPETIVWQLSNATYRAQAVALWIQWINAFRAGGYTGDIGIYGGHADWHDYARVLLGGNGQPLENYWQRFDTWEREVRPLMSVVNTCYPSVYFVDQWLGEDNLEQQKAIQKIVFYMIHNAIKHNHGYNKKIEWFVSHHKYVNSTTEIALPDGVLDWQLSELSKYGGAVNIWGGPEFQIADYLCGVIMGHAD